MSAVNRIGSQRRRSQEAPQRRPMERDLPQTPTRRIEGRASALPFLSGVTPRHAIDLGPRRISKVLPSSLAKQSKSRRRSPTPTSGRCWPTAASKDDIGLASTYLREESARRRLRSDYHLHVDLTFGRPPQTRLVRAPAGTAARSSRTVTAIITWPGLGGPDGQQAARLSDPLVKPSLCGEQIRLSNLEFTPLIHVLHYKAGGLDPCSTPPQDRVHSELQLVRFLLPSCLEIDELNTALDQLDKVDDPAKRDSRMYYLDLTQGATALEEAHQVRGARGGIGRGSILATWLRIESGVLLAEETDCTVRELARRCPQDKGRPGAGVSCKKLVPTARLATEEAPEVDFLEGLAKQGGTDARHAPAP